ncbi:MAG: peptidoglycan DD-metalloendopeptidase family protein [Actinomycetota bacterium]|nr:peptidoglycan DD-metalloendopeptidase family protein [Actinomycetota bacterium]
MRRLLLLGIVAALVAQAGVAGGFDLSDDLAEVNRRIDAVNERIVAANSGRTAVVADIVATRDQLELRQAELFATEDELDSTEQQRLEREGVLDSLRRQLQESYQALIETRRSLVASKEEAREWVRAAYIGTNDGLDTVAFSADTVTSVYVGLEYLSLLAAENDRSILVYESLQTQEERQQVRIESDETEVADQVGQLEDIEAELAALAAEQAEQAAAVATDLAALATKLDKVDEDIAEFADELDGLEAEQSRVEQLIEGEASKDGIAPGILVRPVPGAITSPFGMRMHPILGYSRMHTGVDMSAPLGQEIKAGGSGRVILAGPYGGYGNAVIIDHGGGMTTLYAHQSQLNVSYGQQVAAADIIGYVGSTGLSTGPHLHFEVRLSGRVVDPEDYI